MSLAGIVAILATVAVALVAFYPLVVGDTASQMEQGGSSSSSETLVAEGLSEDPAAARENAVYLQHLIDKTSEQGGGTILLPEGAFCFSATGEHELGNYAIEAKDNVKIAGAGQGKTVLMPVGVWAETGLCEHGVDMFAHFGIDGDDYLTNADFEDFTIDGSLTRGNPDSYNASGKGFYFKLFKDCDWLRVAVKNTDGTGFGMDFPINCSVADCEAVGCGKNATSEDVGASGFGIGTGYSDRESIVITNCDSRDNTKFGFFFEHQTRFVAEAEALDAEGFVVKDCSASGNLYNFGGARAHDVTYERCVSEVSEIAERESYTVRAFCFENHSCRTLVVDCEAEQRFADVAVTDSCYEAAHWALSESLLESGAWEDGEMLFHPGRKMLRSEAVALLWRYAGRPGEVPSGGTPSMPDDYTDVYEKDYFIDAALWMGSMGDASLDEFRGEDPVTKAELITMMWRMAGKPNDPTAPELAGVGEASFYAQAYVWAADRGLVSETDAAFDPHATYTRADVVMLLRAYDKLSDAGLL